MVGLVIVIENILLEILKRLDTITKCWVWIVGSLPVFSSFNDWPTFTKTSFRLSSFLLGEHYSEHRLCTEGTIVVNIVFSFSMGRELNSGYRLSSFQMPLFFSAVHTTSIAHSPLTDKCQNKILFRFLLSHELWGKNIRFGDWNIF
jgi:hypothetical protein